MAKPPLGGDAPPQKYPEIPPPMPQPSGDYSYTLEVVMNLTATVGKLTEAVESLKAQSKGNSEKLEQLGKDMHVIKIGMAIIGAVLVAILGGAAKSVFDLLLKKN